MARCAFDVIIVGAGHAGAQAAIALRQHGFGGTIAMLGSESELPYERPPLSKEYLAGAKLFDRMLIRPASFWREREVAMFAGTTVTSVDAAAHRVICATGQVFNYGRLIWATGGAARRLACTGSDLGGVHVVRCRADVDGIAAELPDAAQIVIVGGGYIGLESAAVLTKLGKQVTLLEAMPRVLARVAGNALSAFFEAVHRAHGVDVRTGATVSAIEGHGHVSSVCLADGTRIAADLVIVGIGIVPAVAPLLAAGAVGADGVFVDEFCRTTLPDVFAAGDCAAHANAFAHGATIRLESVQNANDQATTAARAICGDLIPYRAVPWFWSNQYDLKLQTVGLSAGHDLAVVRGEPADRRFSVIYLSDGRVVALDCVNSVRDYVQGRRLVEEGLSPDPALLADPAVPLKDLH